MFGKRKDPQRAGEVIAARTINAAVEAATWISKLRVSPPLSMMTGPYGTMIYSSRQKPIWAKLSGSTSPYSWTEQTMSSPGVWTTLTGGRSGTASAYEANGASGMAGAVVPIWHQLQAAYAFQVPRFTSVCSGSAQICATITDDGCGGILTGALITVKQGSTTIGTCTTTGVVISLNLTSGGGGWTNGTGYAIGFSGGAGSGAAGTFDVVGGTITHLVLTAGGTGYTSSPTLDFSAAGAGSGQIISASVLGQCCVPITNSGTYTVTCDVPGATQLSTTINATCSLTANGVNFAYTANALGTACFHAQQCGNVPVSGATVTITGAGSASGTTDASGNYCVRLGAGSYSAVIAYPSGATNTHAFTVAGCTTTNNTTTGVSSICLSALTDFPCGCTAAITVKRSDTSATIGTGTMTTANTFGVCQGTTCISFTEVIIGDFVSFNITYAWTNFSNTSPFSMACYGSGTPASIDFRGFGAPC